MSLFLFQQKIPFQSAIKHLRVFEPGCQTAPDVWARAHAENAAPGDIIAILDPIYSPWGDSSSGIGVSDGDSFKVAEMLVCLKRESGSVAVYDITAENYEHGLLDAFFIRHLQHATANGAGFYYAIIRPQGALSLETLLEVGRIDAHGPSGPRRDEQQSVDVPVAFLKALGHCTDVPGGQLLDIGQFCYSLFCDKEPNAGSNVPDLRRYFALVDASKPVEPTAPRASAPHNIPQDYSVPTEDYAFRADDYAVPTEEISAMNFDQPAAQAFPPTPPKMPAFFIKSGSGKTPPEIKPTDAQNRIVAPKPIAPPPGLQGSAPPPLPASIEQGPPTSGAVPPPIPGASAPPAPGTPIAPPIPGKPVAPPLPGTAPTPPLPASASSAPPPLPGTPVSPPLDTPGSTAPPPIPGSNSEQSGAKPVPPMPGQAVPPPPPPLPVSGVGGAPKVVPPMPGRPVPPLPGQPSVPPAPQAPWASGDEQMPTPDASAKLPPPIPVLNNPGSGTVPPLPPTLAAPEPMAPLPPTAAAPAPIVPPPLPSPPEQPSIASLLSSAMDPIVLDPVPEPPAPAAAADALPFVGTEPAAPEAAEVEASEPADASSIPPLPPKKRKADPADTARAQEMQSRAQLKKPVAVKSGVAGYASKVEQQANKAASRLEAQIDEIQTRLTEELNNLLNKAKTAEERSVKSADGLRMNLTGKLDSTTHEVKGQVHESSERASGSIREHLGGGTSAIDEKHEFLRTSLNESFGEVRARAEAIAKSFEDSLKTQSGQAVNELEELREELRNQFSEVQSHYEHALQSAVDSFNERLKNAAESISGAVENRHQLLQTELANLHARSVAQLLQTKAHLVNQLSQQFTLAETEICKLQATALREQILPRLQQHREELRVLTTEFQTKLADDLQGKGDSKLQEFEPVLAEKKAKLNGLLDDTTKIKIDIQKQLKSSLDEIANHLKTFVDSNINEAESSFKTTEEQLAEIDRAVRALADPSSIEGDLELLNERNEVLSKLDETTEAAIQDVLNKLRTSVASLEERGKHLQEDLISSMEEDAYVVRRGSEQALVSIREAIRDSFVAIQSAQDERMPM